MDLKRFLRRKRQAHATHCIVCLINCIIRAPYRVVNCAWRHVSATHANVAMQSQAYNKMSNIQTIHNLARPTQRWAATAPARAERQVPKDFNRFIHSCDIKVRSKSIYVFRRSEDVGKGVTSTRPRENHQTAITKQRRRNRTDQCGAQWKGGYTHLCTEKPLSKTLTSDPQHP
jgi:hypothetical protein